ncbi:MAG TPA: hypothetical protein VNH64_07560 [Parvularculaceae bacterium]|nr:hypothetical protein [Parvularculaceae bacterium]
MSANIDKETFFQKKGGVRTSFNFLKDKLEYAAHDGNTSVEFSVGYGDILLTKHLRRRNFIRMISFGAVALLLGVGNIVHDGITGEIADRYIGSIVWCLIGAALITYALIRRVELTIFDTRRGRIVIANDSQCDEILAKLKDSRAKWFIERFGAINPNNPPDQEIAKIEWLVQQEALSREEADKLIRSVKQPERKTEELPPTVH